MYLYLYVLVVDELDSFSAVDAHIFSKFVQAILERIDCGSIDDVLWQVVPIVNNSAIEECSSHCR